MKHKGSKMINTRQKLSINTIFALRVFDDTGKQFLKNYIGSDYANTLPTLEERHAIVVGKALKLRQPVIIRLNDMENIIR